MQLHFAYNEFVKLDGVQADIPISATLAQKVLVNFLLPLNDIRLELGLPIEIRSGYRPPWWEHVKGRDGTSQHCFEGKGACDIALINAKKGDWIRFFELLVGSGFQRIAYYPDSLFFHIDYKVQKRQYFINKNRWQSSTAQDIRKTIRTS